MPLNGSVLTVGDSLEGCQREKFLLEMNRDPEIHHPALSLRTKSQYQSAPVA